MCVLAKVADGGVEPVESHILPLDERRAGLRSTGQDKGGPEGLLGELHLESGSASLDTGDTLSAKRTKDWAGLD